MVNASNQDVRCTEKEKVSSRRLLNPGPSSYCHLASIFSRARERERECVCVVQVN